MKSIPQTPLGELVAKGWPDVHTTKGSLPQNDLQSLIRMLRNSIAHCNVEFISDVHGEVGGIRLWNCRGREITWEAVLAIGDLRAIAFKFVELLEQDHGPQGRIRHRI